VTTITAGTRLAAYEITGLLGTGGMGQVYRAHDSRLNRDVALKVLKDDAVTSAQTARLAHEARLISTLNHPHIRAVYDVAEHDGSTVIVMEYVEGETLDQRLARKPIPLPLALTYGQQLASALDAAHSHGIVHHDIKPANILVTVHGVKLLDFGIATVKAAAPPSRKDAQASTQTDSGGIVGTTPYMAPEQLDGSDQDGRSDIFALGIVLYEMLAGRNPFAAPTRARTIAAILEHEPPPLASLIASVPPTTDHVVMKCLAKDPHDRWQTARDLAGELSWLSRAGTTTVAVPRTMSRRLLPLILVAFASVALAIVLAMTWRRPPEPYAPPVRFLAAAPPDSVITVAAGAFAISPDGRYLAFTASSAGGPRLLWVRALDSFEAHPLSGTDEAGFPFWSPNSRTIAFLTPTELKTIDVSGSPLQTVARLPPPQSGPAPLVAQWGTWGGNGDILFTTGGASTSLYRVRASGGTPQPLATNDTHPGRRVGGPEFLPDGVHFLLGVVEPEKPQDQVSIYVGTFDNPFDRLLLRADSQAIYAAPGYILYMRAGSLIAHPFDLSSQQTTGEPVSLPEPAGFVRTQRRASFSASRTGVLGYRQGVAITQLTWFDRSGRRLGVVGSAARWLNPAIAPDANRIAVTRLGPSTTQSDIWLFEPRGERQLTSSAGMEDYAVWSPDGSRVVYGSDARGFFDIYAKDTSASAQEPSALVLETDHQKLPMDWTPNGKWLVFLDSAGGVFPRLPLAYPFGADHERVEDVTLAGNPSASLRSEDQVQVSPDGHWMAYVSDVAGSAQVYVRAFPDGQRRWQVSTEGGFEPKWRGDGRELFYIASDQQMMSVAVSSVGLSFDAGRPSPLFRTTVLGAPFQNGVVRNEYAVTRDGQRFLVNEPIEGAAAYAIRVLLNWPSLLRSTQ
jgi:Tol biopolymer transport system component/predicted Ser/Thr protein kinase